MRNPDTIRIHISKGLASAVSQGKPSDMCLTEYVIRLLELEVKRQSNKNI